MGDTAANWLKEYNTVKADCIKRLGKKGKFPRPKKDPAAELTKAVAQAKSLDDQIKKLIKALATYQDLCSGIELYAYDYKKLFPQNDFGLSLANTDEEKTIYKVRSAMDKVLSDIELGSKTPRRYATKIRDILESGESITDF